MKQNIHIYILLLFIIFISLYFGLITNNIDEGFTPKIRELYRPYIRNVRIYSSNLHNKYKTNVINFLRRIGLI